MSPRTAAHHDPSKGGAYPLFILVLCVAVLGALTVDATIELGDETRRLLSRFDFVVSLIFLFDFGLSFKRAENKARYMATWGWIDLLSSIPAVGPLRWGRAARIVRILRVLRGLRSIRLITTMILARKRTSTALATLCILLLTLFAGSIAVLEFERAGGGNIVTSGDALWWAIATMSTAGFGDLYPITTEGRVVAAVLMFVGIGLFGAVTGIVASLLVEHDEEQHDRDEAELETLRERVAELERQLEDRA